MCSARGLSVILKRILIVGVFTLYNFGIIIIPSDSIKTAR
jgi:hypothetical protein